jgi:peptidoglycan biosynthesis protein MviN/MurJ (putative lipid II flippase)
VVRTVPACVRLVSVRPVSGLFSTISSLAMRRQLIVFGLSLLLLACAWIWNVVAYAGDEEDTPGWLVAIWLVLWGVLVISLIWAIGHLVRARGRAHRGGTAG